ncbi:MAG: NUDIX hydrolase [Armatimonadota bacterium]
MCKPEDMRVIAEGKYIRLINKAGWEYVERLGISGIVGVAAVTDEGNILLVEQYRPALAKYVIELPAGLAGDAPEFKGEDLSSAARRELLEETGYSASTMDFICEGPPSSGMSSEMITLFKASGLKKETAGGGDETEELVLYEIPVDGIHQWLERQRSSGKLIDLRIYTALFFV